jgi:hypothetical protein
VSSLIVVPAVLALLFSVTTTGTFPPSSLEPLFDDEAAAELAGRLSTEYPARVPGTVGAQDAARWFSETISAFGFAVEEDVWREDLPGLGEVELHNVAAIVPGRSDQAILLVAHRDNAGTALGHGDNASGTAALIELARGFAPRGATIAPQPQRTLVLLSTDGGAYGGAGAARFATTSDRAEGAFAAVVLDGIGGSGRPRIAIAGNEPRSPAPAFVRTAEARILEQARIQPSLTGPATQLVDLAVPFAIGEQGHFLAAGIAALTITTDDPGDPPIPYGDPETGISTSRLGDLGRATEALVGSIDGSVGAAFRTPDTLFFEDRVASGWALRLTLLVALVPFALGALDLFVRTRRRQVALRPAVRALRTRLGLWLYAGILLWLGGVAGLFPTGAPLPVPPYSSAMTDRSLAGLALLAVVLVGGWVVGRRRLVAARRPTPEERLAGYAVSLGWLAVVSIVIGLVKPYALVFVLPSLYAWLWLPLRARMWARVGLLATGLVAPLVGLSLLARQVGLGLVDTVLYVAGLITIGYISWVSVALGLAWLAAAGQLTALVAGRYSPYAGGAEPPPGGRLRTALGSILRASPR